MNRLNREYQLNDTTEEKRIMFAIVMAGIVFVLVMSLVANVVMIEMIKKLV